MDWTNFNESLKLMAMGMAGIFAFILIFYGLVMVLIKVFPEKPQAENNN
ncbi:MAG: OadG-related small transporter subunit [bacterium]|nr:OadG-related small transporter subunit [bacterium]